MAERPIFVPDEDAPGLVREVPLHVAWQSGFGPVRKKENVKALHDAAARAGFPYPLEVSTKSDRELGRQLSAFSLTCHGDRLGDMPLECAYQGSKVFARGGPYTDLYKVDARTAKRDARLKESGRLLGFRFEDFEFPLEPRTAFYDWLYINAVLPRAGWLKHRIDRCSGFTDIEFNPGRSVNCQARSCALFVSLMRKDLLGSASLPPETFLSLAIKYPGRADITDPV